MNKKICIIVYNYADYGGVEYVATNLVNEFCKENSVCILSLNSDDRKWAYQPDPRVEIYSVLDKEYRLRTQQFKLFKPVKRFLKEHAIDIAIIMGHYSGFMISPVMLFSKTKFIFCDHGALMNQWDDKKNRFMRYLASKLSDLTVTLTERNRDDYIHRFHISKRKVRCVYNWIDVDPLPGSYDVSSRKIISVGRLGEEKGFDLLVEIFAEVVKKHPDWHLDIFGDGEMQPVIENKLIEYKMEDHITLKGMDPNVYAYYRDYAMYVLPSYREGLPIVLLEAKMNDLPIVSFDVLTGPREIIEDGESGILVAPKDKEAFADAVNELIDDTDMRLYMSKHAKDNLGLFSKDTVLKQWNEIIDEF